MSELQIKRKIASKGVPADGSMKEGELIVNPADARLWVGAVGADGTGGIPPISLNPTVSVKIADFSIDITDGVDHHYKVASVADGGAAAIVVTIPTGLPVGHRFQVSCQADTTFV